MSKFDELKKGAEAAIEREDCNRFIERDDAQAILELLAIQAQLVEALAESRRYVIGAYECAFPDEGKNLQVLSDVDAALAAAGAQS